MKIDDKNRITTTNSDYIITDFLLEELERMTTNLVVKLEYRAKKHETTSSREEGDMYVEAYNRTDIFESYQMFPPEVIRLSGLAPGTPLSSGELVTQKMFENYCTHPHTIPFEYRDVVLNHQRVYVVNNYVEKNTYYRELNGEPPLDENPKEFVYLKKPIKDVDITKPIHLMSRKELTKLKVEGTLDYIVSKNKTKRYLAHLLDLKIPYHIARKATNFSILHLTRPIHHEGLSDRFLSLYSQSVAYVKETIYDSAYSVSDEFYDGMIGMFILTITIQRFIVNYFKSGIKREFFNKDIIRMYLDSYGIPFYSDISLTYLTRIAKNLNLLLLYKATDQIFVDIFALFGLKEVSIYKYFLLKQRRLNNEHEPIFAYKEIIDEEGHTKQVEDLKAMYDLKFVSVPADTKQLSVDIINPSNYIDYNLVVEDDYLWGGDGDREEFLEEVLASEFNYIETKYIAMTSKYELAKLGFELCYFFKMIYDLKPKEEHLIVTLPSGRHTLFDTFAALMALSSMNLNFDGNIMETPSKTLQVLGYNFNADKEYIARVIREANLENPEEIIIDNPPETFYNQVELLNLYFKNRTVVRTLLKRKNEAKTIEEYNAYKRIYDATLITTYNTEFYKLKDGTPAKKYVDYLEENDINLYKLVKETNKDTIVENLENLLVGLDEYFKSDKFDNIFLNIPNLSLESVKRFVFYLVDIFKSYTVDLIAMNVLYHMGSKDSEYVKILDVMHPTATMEYSDKVDKDADRREQRPGMWFRDMIVYPTPFYVEFKNQLHLNDMLDGITVTEYKLDNIEFTDKTQIETEIGNPNNNVSDICEIEKIDILNNNIEHNNSIKLKDYIFIERKYE